MELPQVIIDGIEMRIHEYMPISTPSKWSTRVLAGIDCELRTGRRSEIEQLNDLFGRKQVEVNDPLVGRVYQASILRTQERYSDDNPNHYYEVQLRELDLPPVITTIRVNDEPVPVIKYTASDIYDGSGIRHSLLLRLTPEQFQRFYQNYHRQTVQMLREGVDDQPQSYLFGGNGSWSEHMEGDEVYYKQVVFFVPPDYVPSQHPGFASDQVQIVLVQMMRAVTARFEVLVNDLANHNVISSEKQQALLQDDWNSLVSPERVAELSRVFVRVDNAEEDL